MRYRRAESEAIAHLWRWRGRVVGVDDDLLPADHAQAVEFFRVAAEFEPESDAASHVPVDALLRDGRRSRRRARCRAATGAAVIVSALDALAGPILRRRSLRSPPVGATPGRVATARIPRGIGMCPEPVHAGKRPLTT
ncbi:oxygenase MpaB family protein [Gordonia aurantiaca]|uniref:oxygenase MpaB family protein n=1 Tax=Gordonia sp. B21 TaxID=3151852 RepID=UPI0032641180